MHFNIKGPALLVQFPELILNFMGELDDIGLGIVDNLQGDRIHAVYPADGLLLLFPVKYLCNIL